MRLKRFIAGRRVEAKAMAGFVDDGLQWAFGLDGVCGYFLATYRCGRQRVKAILGLEELLQLI